ncbi:MAG: ACT domain-containing protein, partial [Halobacteriaceae archaeon]
INIDMVASGMDSITFYVDPETADRAERILHRRVIDDEVLSSVTVSDDLAVVRLLGGELQSRPGLLQEIVVPLAEAGINIHDLITSATSVAVFVAWEDGERTLDIVQEHFDTAPVE